ncbi:MAG: TIGR04086 family membrane protein [Bacillota bacterium]
MDFEREDSSIPVGSVVYGVFAVLLWLIILTVFLAAFTELGWTATVTWPDNHLYLIIFYAAVTIGSITAGWRSRERGWVVGAGVGFLSSVLLLILAFIMHQRFNIGVFMVKMFISSFIGAFGGIIGVNLGGK